MLRERFARRRRSGTLFGMYPRGWRGESSRRGEGVELDREAGAAASRGPRGTKLVEADGAPLVDVEALKAMVRLLRIVQVFICDMKFHVLAAINVNTSIFNTFLSAIIQGSVAEASSKSLHAPRY